MTFTWVPKNTDFLYFFTFFFWVSKSWWEHRIIPTMCITILVLGRKITNSELFSVFIPHWNPIPPPWGKAGLCHTSKKFLSCFLIVFSNAWFSFATQGAIFFNASMFYSSQKCTLHSGWKSKKSLTYLYSLCTLQILLCIQQKGCKKNVRYSCVFYWFFRGFSTLSTLYTLHWRLLMALWALTVFATLRCWFSCVQGNYSTNK